MQIVVCKTLTHDSDQHVKQMDTHEERHADEQEEKDWSHIITPIGSWVEFSQRREVNMVKCTWNCCVRRWISIFICFEVFLVLPNNVEGHDEAKQANHVNKHEVFDVINYNKDDVNERCYLSYETKEV